MRWRLAVAGWAMAAVGVSPAMFAFQAGTLPLPAPALKSYVLYVAEDHDVHAGKRTVLELHFRVADGYHVNSHTPKSVLLIPTDVVLQPAAGISEETAEYPAGKNYSFSFDPSNKLSVYTGDFVVKVPVVATAGAHTISGKLHYQACDHAACYPPRDLPVQIIFTAR
ncbi:protein-disulfide reductase DsbD N-terminal domain-containing protein [Edaphobacter sp.]|uniref:protein-disulfide reductase DsbD N-terminal domain-containing protein n=1 Tax=Edaphobacter sp. TaxID=1934404 RepID=UPI002DBF3EC0|nr:protein-disulfide reductase DsbD N-terminal domain-containing protein [Edaphobacter sp.]HEU5341864.1 protein-disulfide reductase DsbD N-terminal domain-containing protein [Edaphobacter sp.]